MPRGSPFTSLCRQFAGLAGPRGADLHVHTTASDGAFTPSQAVALARQAKVAAIAITDHDTLAGLPEARQTASEMPSPSVEVLSGVEITTTFRGRELHLLGYFVREDHAGLNSLLTRSCDMRRARFHAFRERLEIPDHAVEPVLRTSTSLGRRHVASLLVRTGRAKNHHDAWTRFVAPISREVPTAAWPSIEDAIAIVRNAGGIASLAHPPENLEEAEIAELQSVGMDAIEVIYPWSRSTRSRRVREIADRLGLLATGGSDCHGAEPAHRAIGSHTIGADMLGRLCDRARLREDAGVGSRAFATTPPSIPDLS